jgi:DNA-binding CsgD family transcriptional regulator/tetratricopeptide (TPR) repeat protein
MMTPRSPCADTGPVELLERQPQLGALHEYVADLRSRDGRLVLISGEAGVGKSTLIDELEHEAPSDLRWYVGACDGLFTPRALGPLRDIAVQVGEELTSLVAPGVQREDLFAAFLDHLREVGPVVVVIEDVHWADEATLDLLRYVGRRLRKVPALLLVSYRDDGVSANDALRIALGELATLRATRRVSVPPLTRPAVERLAVSAGLQGDQLYRLTGGNPFFVSEMLQSAGSEIPPSARDAVLARLGRLSEPARTCAWVAALMGARVEPELLAVVAPDLPPALDELLASGILVADGAGLRFRHELTRLAVEQDVPIHHARDVHTALLRILLTFHEERDDVDAARLAYHAEGAADGDAVLLWAPHAGRQAAALGAHREATEQFQRAVRFIGGADQATAADIYDHLAVEQSLADAWDRAAESAELALRLWREVGDRAREGGTLCFLSRVTWRLCRPEELEYAEAGLAAVEPLGDGPELARATGALAFACAHAARTDRALELADRAEQLARRHGLDDVLAESMIVRGIVTSAMECVVEGLHVAVDAGESELAGCAYGYLQDRLQVQRRFAEAEHWFREGEVYCEEHDIATWGYCLEAHHGTALMERGEYQEAALISRRVLTRSVISPENRVASLLCLGIVLARRGQHDEAAPYLDEAAESAVRSRLDSWVAEVLPVRAEARWLAGDDDGARADLILTASARAARGPWWLGRIETWTRRLGMPPTEPDSTCPEPYLLWLGGRPDEAAVAFDELGSPYDAALALYDVGDEAGLREALARFEALGADAASHRTRRALRELGVRGVPTGARLTTRANPAGLTQRELEVLDLVGAGLTNDQIADHLVISPRTVDHHVSAVLGKLGARTRGEASERARRLGLLADPRPLQPGGGSVTPNPATARRSST